MCVCTLMNIWKFPEIGVPPVIIYVIGISPYNPSILGYHDYGNPHVRHDLNQAKFGCPSTIVDSDRPVPSGQNQRDQQVADAKCAIAKCTGNRP